MIVLFRFKFWRRKSWKNFSEENGTKDGTSFGEFDSPLVAEVSIWRKQFYFWNESSSVDACMRGRTEFKRARDWSTQGSKGHLLNQSHCSVWSRDRLSANGKSFGLSNVRAEVTVHTYAGNCFCPFADTSITPACLPVCRTSHTWTDSAFFFAHHPRSKTALSPSFFYSSIILIQFSTGYFFFSIFNESSNFDKNIFSIYCYKTSSCVFVVVSHLRKSLIIYLKLCLIFLHGRNFCV